MARKYNLRLAGSAYRAGKIELTVNCEAVKRPNRNWAAEITEAWNQMLESIIRTGKILLEAKAALPHGKWLALIREALPFKERTAQRLMAIAANDRLTNAAHGPHLPPSWRTLHELTRLTDQQFECALAEGYIHPEMERSDAEFLRRQLTVEEGGDANYQHSRKINALMEARDHYLKLCQPLSKARREKELRICSAALSTTAKGRIAERHRNLFSKDEAKVALAHEIIALRAARGE